jgi:hypothetical protein
MKRIIFIFFLTLLFIYVFCSRIIAQENPSVIGVTPAIVETVLNPKGKYEAKVYVYNISEKPLPVRSSVKALVPQDEIFTSNKEIFDSTSWIKVEPKEFILNPKETKEIILKIEAPAKTEPGSHYSTVYFESLNIQDKNQIKNIGISTKIGILTFITVPGDLKEKIEISKFHTETYRQFGPVNFNLILKNSGNVHLLPKMTIRVVDMFNHSTALPVKPTIVLPYTFKEIEMDWQQPKLFGRYKSYLEITYGTGKQNIRSQTITFWIIPWMIITPIIFLTSFVIYLTINYRKLIKAIKILLNAK